MTEHNPIPSGDYEQRLTNMDLHIFLWAHLTSYTPLMGENKTQVQFDKMKDALHTFQVFSLQDLLTFRKEQGSPKALQDAFVGLYRPKGLVKSIEALYQRVMV